MLLPLQPRVFLGTDECEKEDQGRKVKRARLTFGSMNRGELG